MPNAKSEPGTETVKKSQLAYEALREMIIAQAFSDEANWSLRKLAAKLKMSVVPVAEALRRLEQEGIVEVKSRRGISVRQLSAREMEDLKVIREGLEVQAARILAIYKPKDVLHKLHRMAERLQKALREEKYAQAVVIDFQLHRAMVHAAQAPLLTQQYDRMVTLTMIGTGGYGPRMLQAEMCRPVNHVQLVETLAKGTPQEADRAIRDHIRTQADPRQE